MWALAFRNLLQKKPRTILTIVGLALATGTLFSLLAFQAGYERGLKKELGELGAHILVVPKGCPYDAASLALHGANWPCYLKMSYLSQVAQTPGVAVAAPVFMSAHYGAQGLREVLVGVTRDYLELKPQWNINGQFPDKPTEVLLGADAAKQLNASVGSTIRLQSMEKEFAVTGILSPTGGPDDTFIFLQLVEIQTALKQRDFITHVLVKLKNPETLDQTVNDLRGCDAGMQMNIIPLAHLFETIRQVTTSARYLLAGLTSVAFIIAGTTLVNTMLMTVLERTRDIGVMRAIGASTSQIFSLFLAEALLLSLSGAISGILAAMAGSSLIEHWIRSKIPYSPEAPLVNLDLNSAILSLGFALFIACLAGLLPAARAARLHPVQAFRAQASY